jgi:hypothetical protein
MYSEVNERGKPYASAALETRTSPGSGVGEGADTAPLQFISGGEVLEGEPLVRKVNE